MSYREHFAAHLRLTLLRLLAEASSYRVNDSLLTCASDGVGVPATRDQVRQALTWLDEAGLVTIDSSIPGLLIATATERGLDVAAGRSVVPGVQRPSPKG